MTEKFEQEENTTLADRLFDSKEAECIIEDGLEQAGMSFSHIGWDDYDCSLELYGVDPLHRLTDKAQEFIYDAGFIKCYVNHKDKWETHYTYDHSKPFVPAKGWRVSYPHKRNEDPAYKGSIWIEEACPSWPKEWAETGYTQIKPPNYTEDTDAGVPDTTGTTETHLTGRGDGYTHRPIRDGRWVLGLLVRVLRRMTGYPFWEKPVPRA